MATESLDELLKRDKQRVEDGFLEKIRFRKILVGSGKIITVPYVEEEKLIHGDFEPTGEHGEVLAGQGEGSIGQVIHEESFSENGDGDDSGNEPGQGGEDHGIESEAYELGKELSRKLELPNLKDKSKKVPTDEYTYDLTDRHRGSGQFLDKKATLKRVINSNTALGRINPKNIDMGKLIVGPRDKVYRILSRERVWRSQAIVFFLRDYSGSMMGEPTKTVVTQHLMIYSWLLVQFERLVIPRFIVHDVEAKEVSARDYFIKNARGGTFISSGYKKILEIIETENLAKNYNIYIFQGTDGDDADDGRVTTPEVEKLLRYANRIGVTVVRDPASDKSRFEKYIEAGGFPSKKDLFRLYVLPSYEISEEEIEESVKELVAQDLKSFVVLIPETIKI